MAQAALRTKHAGEAMVACGLRIRWIEAAASEPEWVGGDPRHSEVTRSFKVVEELGGRVLRVVHRRDGNDARFDHRSSGQGCEAMMRTSYDPEADAMFVWFAPEGTKSAETNEVAPGCCSTSMPTGR